MQLKNPPARWQMLWQSVILLLCGLTAVCGFIGTFVSLLHGFELSLGMMYWHLVAAGVIGIWLIAGVIYELGAVKRLLLSS